MVTRTTINLYDEDAAMLQPESNGSFTSSVSSVSTFLFCGASNFSILLPHSLSAHTGLTIQGNNANLYQKRSAITFNSYGNLSAPTGERTYNSSFNQCWIDIGSIATGDLGAIVSVTPVRYLRLAGSSVTGTFSAYIWTETSIQAQYQES